MRPSFSLLITLSLGLSTISAAEFRSHPPMRPLPHPSKRALTDGPSFYVDAAAGNDQADGSKNKPWKTLQHAVLEVSAGDTIYLRGGTYYEHATITVRATRNKPLTIRSFPGELAVIDGGLREFFEVPESAWEPVADGAAGEFRSKKAFPNISGRAGSTNILGNFGDSMIPLHGYRYIEDLRSDNEYLAKIEAGKTEAGSGAYCGPGVFFDVETKRIHIRLAHTKQTALGRNNYRGETDPRKLPLIISGDVGQSALTIDGSAFVRIQDIVMRGSRAATLSIVDSVNIELDGVTMYGGASPIGVKDTAGLRLWNCACRGIAAPWTFRGSLKYRAIEARLFSASGWSPTGRDNRDFELAYSEFTDCVDGVFIGNVGNVRFHHNWLDNVSDDGIFLTATTAYDGKTLGGNVHIYQNLLSRCLTTFAFGVGHGRQKMTRTGRQTGDGVFIYRNVFDLREAVHYQQPAAGELAVTSSGRVSGDHGGPLWEPMTIYHNTIITRETPFRAYYAAGVGSHMAGGSMRRLFNNVVVQVSGRPGNVLPPVIPVRTKAELAALTKTKKKKSNPLNDLLDGGLDKKTKKSKPKISKDLKGNVNKPKQPSAPLPVDFQTDGNLHWSYDTEASAESMFGRFRGSPAFATSKRLYQPGWTVNDVVADPGFVSFDATPKSAVDLRPKKSSPARDAGVPIAKAWPDPLRTHVDGKPDIGAIPFHGTPSCVGIGGRIDIFGRPVARTVSIEKPTEFLVPDDKLPQRPDGKLKPVVIVQGYPAFDAPLLEYALHKRNIQFESLQKTWLKTSEYSKYSTVILVGDLVRARIEPNRYTDDDVLRVREFLNNGGTLWLMRGNQAVFREPVGLKMLLKLTGAGVRRKKGYRVLDSKHRWLRHLKKPESAKWVSPGHAQAMRATNGQLVIGNESGLTTLYRLSVGKGQLIYVGWDISSSLPHGRKPSTVEQEAVYEEQMQLLQNIVDDVVGQPAKSAS